MTRGRSPIDHEFARLARKFVALAAEDGLAVTVARAGRKLKKKLRGHPLLSRLMSPSSGCRYFRPAPECDPYDVWRAINSGNAFRRRRLEGAQLPTGEQPRFSVLVPIYNPPIDVLRAMLESVCAQSYRSWELVLVDDASPDERVRRELREWSARDSRIKLIVRSENGNIVAATNQAAEAATGDFFVFVDHDDLLDRDALAHLAIYLDAHPDTDLVYSDDDKVEAGRGHHSPQFKPDWSPELLLAFCYTAHLSGVSRSLFREVGGLRSGFDGSQDHDFWLRASERARRIGHIPQVLYHWRVLPGSTALGGSAKPASFDAGRRAVEEAFARRGVGCTVKQADWARRAGCSVFEPLMPDDGPSVAIVIDAGGDGRVPDRLLASLSKTTYQNYRVYLTRATGDAQSGVIVLSGPEQISTPAAIANAAAREVTEDLILFLGSGTELIAPRWLSQMVGWSRLPGVGAVGARLLNGDRSIQELGMFHGFHDSVVSPAFQGLPAGEPGYWNLARVTRDTIAVGSACLLTPRATFLAHGGFDAERFPAAYFDADFGYRLHDAGLRLVACAEAILFNHDHQRTSAFGDPRELAEFRRVHGRRVDPYFSPHCDPESVILEPRPTVVPVGGTGPPVKVLAAMHSLNWEGAPRFEFELLTRLKQAGAIDAEIVCPRDGPMRLAYEKKGIPIRIEGRLSGLSGQPKLFPDAISALASVVKEGGYQVVHANTLEAFWAVLAARRAQVPAVWSIHESDPWQTYFDDWPPALAADALESLSYAYRVVFSATSSADRWRDLDTTGNYALARFPLDVNRFQSELAQSDRETARNTLGLAPDDFCVLLLGTICERKGQHDLFHAFRNLPPEIAARTTCLVVGYRDGIAYGRKLKDLVRSLPPERRERFRVIDETGATSPFWRAADLFCCSSRVESYPHVILEAMAAGLPIVTTPVFGIAEQVRPSVNGLFYEPGNGQKLAEHLITLATDRELRTRFAEASPWVLRGLPRDRDVDVAYERIFRAAAESTPWPIAVNALKSERLRHHGHGENTPARRPTSLVESPRRAN